MNHYYYYYEVINRDQNRRPIYEYRCDERPKAKAAGSTRLTYTGLSKGCGVYFQQNKRRLYNKRRPPDIF